MRRILALFAALLLLCGCTSRDRKNSQWSEMQPTRQMELAYATAFSVDEYSGGLSLVTIGEDQRFLLLPKGTEPPEGLDGDISVIHIPCQSIYLANSAAMDLFAQLDALDAVRLTSTRAEDWTLPEVAARMEAGTLGYVGKYNAPDYEQVLSENCDLVVENTMIFHKPAVKEQLESLGFPVLVDYASYESHPLGRLEWIRLYGLLTGHQQEADACFDAQARAVSDLQTAAPTGKQVAFFYVTANGAVNVRRSGDYVAEMIRLAGGEYAFDHLDGDETARSTVTMQMEDFYAGAKDADVLIYNSTVGGEIETIDDLLALSPLFADFTAVEQGNVWCTGQNLFQKSAGVADMILDIHAILTGEGVDAVTQLQPVKQ